MKRVHSLLVAAVAFGLLLLPGHAQVYTFTGIGNGWLNQSTPPNDGTASLTFGDHVSDTIPILSPNFSFNNASFVSDNTFKFIPASGSTTLTIGIGGVSVNNPHGGYTTIDFSSNVTVNIGGNQTWNYGNGGGTTIIHGALTGTGNLTLTGTGNTFSGGGSFGLALINPNPGANTYSGNITLGNSSIANVFPYVSVWASGNLGSGTLTFVNGGQLITHNSTNLSNNLVFNSGPLPSGQTNGGVSGFQNISFRAWDAPATYSGTVTLANNTTLNAQLAFPNLQADLPGSVGSWPLAGPRTRNAIIFSGTVGESGGARSLNITGPGIAILSGNNTTGAYTGGTNVGFPAGSSNTQSQGSLIFASQNAIPSTGTIQSGQLNNSNQVSGYVGIAASAVSTAGAFNTFLTRINPASSGAVGIDSLDGSNAPAATAATFSDNINLTSFNTTASHGIRLGTATSIILTGTLTPQLNNVYNFGNGGGKMFVQSSLANLAGGATTLYNDGNGAFPLRLYLQGANTYTGGTSTNSGIIVFDGAGAVPASGQLTAGGTSTYTGNGYIGFTDAVLGTGPVNGSAGAGGLNEAAVGLFAKFNKSLTWGIVGFDSTSLAAPVTINNLDLTGFNDGVFIGTNSAATLTGTITGTSVANGSNAANTLRFTAASGGTLTVAGDIGGATSVVIGPPTGQPGFGDGSVVFSPSVSGNTYSGGTTVNSIGAISLVAGNNSTPFGSGAITLASYGGTVALKAATAGITIPNAITFATGSSANFAYTPTLNLEGSNSLTLSGNISGPNRTAMFTQNDVGQGLIALNNSTPINATVSGDNSGFFGTFLVQNGTMTFASNLAGGHADIELGTPSASVAFTSAAPVVYGLSGKLGGTITLGASTNLTIDTTNTDGNTTGYNLATQRQEGQGEGNYHFDFGGSLVGGAGSTLTLTGTVNPNAGTEFFYAFGSSPNFHGNIAVNNQSALGIGKADSVGDGTITINAVDGGVALNTGVVLTNPIVFNTGGLAGIGTFSPSSISGTGQTAGKITFGANQMIYPGIPGDGGIPGKLTLGSVGLAGAAYDVVFANGGAFGWMLRDPASLEGFSSLYISGNLDLSTLTSAGFSLDLESIGANGDSGFANSIVWGNSYSLAIVTTAGVISGFNPANFTFDVTKFQNGLIPASNFSLTSDSTHLYLNFTAIPEPSSFALLALGLGVVLLPLIRRRRH